MLIATGKIVTPITKKAPAGKSGQSYRYPLPDSIFAENGLHFGDDALLEQVDVCDFLFEVNLQLPFETTFNLAHALPADTELISWQSFWSYQGYCFSDPASDGRMPEGHVYYWGTEFPARELDAIFGGIDLGTLTTDCRK